MRLSLQSSSSGHYIYYSTGLQDNEGMYVYIGNNLVHKPSHSGLRVYRDNDKLRVKIVTCVRDAVGLRAPTVSIYNTNVN